ncbi:MAG: aminotransferase class-III [Herbinix sp.]|nr:aminotransferase class-III [Herbinix sp.]
MDTNFAISQYPDAAAITKQLNELISTPVHSISKEALEQYETEYYGKKCTKSKQMIDVAKTLIPGGVQHNLAFNHPFPLVFSKASGAYLYDIDGNQYYDFLQAGGPTVLGSNPEIVREKVIELLNDCGPSTGLFHEFEYKLAQKISEHIPSVEMFRMLGSGTESCMAAIRVARLATGKKNILKMGGAYHGWSDQLAYGIRIPGSKWTQAHGVPHFSFKRTDEFFPNDLKDLERKLRRNRLHGGTAAVMIEPVGPESGTRPVDMNFNKGVEALCRKYGALLIFDEVVTAFRIGMAGAQGYYGVTPDLTVFVAGYYTLCEIERTKAAKVAGEMGDRLNKGLQELIKKYNLPFVAFNQGSICHLETVGAMHFSINWKKPWTIPQVLEQTSKRKKEMEHMGAAYMAEGIVTLAGSRLYTSAAYTEEMIDDALSRFERVFQKIVNKETEQN